MYLACVAQIYRDCSNEKESWIEVGQMSSKHIGSRGENYDWGK